MTNQNKETRDNFSFQTSEVLKKRAAFICSAPDCKVMTIAPSVAEENKFQYIGICAHISAAVKGGPRYDENMTSEQRSQISNAIFLCNNCATKVDKNNGVDYSVELLKKWKSEHENWVLRNLNKSVRDSSKTILQTNSFNQLGGITAHIVNIATPSDAPTLNRVEEHDKKLFEKADSILTEEVLSEIFDRLRADESIRYNNVEKIYELLTFYKLSGNTFLNDNLEKLKTELMNKLAKLNTFFEKEFDEWPYRQNPENLIICMKPTVNIDRAAVFSPEVYLEHTRLQKILIDNCKDVEQAYSNYRKEIKRYLII